MAASKTGLHHFKDADGKSVYAARISTITEFKPAGAPVGSMRLFFSDLDKQVNLVGQWIRDHNPRVGGYFVVEDSVESGTSCRYMDGLEFDKRYNAVGG